MNVYLDNSVLSRPFDDQFQARIALETEAVVAVLALIQSGEIKMISSSVVHYENSRNPEAEERRWVETTLRLSQIDQPMNDNIQTRARELTGLGMKALDALHAASAEAAAAEFFLTCDDRLARHYQGPMAISTPWVHPENQSATMKTKALKNKKPSMRL